jgi:hypothetical protein
MVRVCASEKKRGWSEQRDGTKCRLAQTLF